jgi:hypothetical protein
MHTFRPSRGRVLFEVFCALGVAASFAGGWVQTGASAFVPAAVIAALYGVVHAFDLAGRGPALSAQEGAEPLVLSEQQQERVAALEPVESVEPEAPTSTKARKSKAPRTPRARRKAAENTKVAELVPPLGEEVISDEVPQEEAIAIGGFAEQELDHVPLTPLFEPEPFVRQQRAVFGRKAG